MCVTPIRIKGKKNEDGMIRQQGHAVVPCGKCPQCKQRRANAWVFRLLKEQRVHTSALFITLTYSNDTVPLTPNGFMTLVKSDYQKFMKRLRFNTGIKSIKYYACGEYGTTTWRPHYHAIIFDVPIDAISKAWTSGHVHIVPDVNGASIGYCTKYICKDARVPLHQNDDRLPEFSLMSKKLGRNYLTPQMIQWHKDNKASYVVVDGGFKQPLPRYYRDFIFTEYERSVIAQKSMERHIQQYESDIQEAGSPTQYYRNRFEQIQAYLLNKRRQANQKRNKI